MPECPKVFFRAAILLGLACHCAWPADSIRVGFGQVIPLYYVGDHGQAAGFIVDAVKEAARRENIAISWERVAGSQDIDWSLERGRIDIFPSGIATAARRSKYWLSNPWWTEDLSLLARLDAMSGGDRNWKGRRIILASQAYLSIAAAVAPGATFEFQKFENGRGNLGLSLPAICSHSADAVLMPHTTADDVLAKRPQGCVGVDFAVIETDQALPLAFISRKTSESVAKRLYARVIYMAQDGTLTRIAKRYPRISARGAVLIAETMRLRDQHVFLLTAFGGMLLVAVVLTFFLSRQLRIEDALRIALKEQADTDRALRARTQELTISNEELQAFAYSVSHDLQEPLRVIGLFTQLLEKHWKGEAADLRHYLTTIRTNALRMQDMIHQLLLLTRLSRSEMPKAAVALDEIVSTVLQDFEVAVAATSAEIVVESLPVVQGWPDRLSVLFQNLIGNALKYRRSNMTPRVEIRAVDRGREWEFCVADNGIGFEQRYASKMFEVFTRLHDRDEYGGTGVGLAIAKRVVERHGGRIWAEGRPGEGSRFYFTIPKQPAPDASEGSNDSESTEAKTIG